MILQLMQSLVKNKDFIVYVKKTFHKNVQGIFQKGTNNISYPSIVSVPTVLGQ